MRTLREQIASKCQHFNGTQNGACKLGIRYDSFPKRQRIPCLVFDGLDSPDICAKREWPTEEMIQQRLDEIESSTTRFAKVTPLIAKIKREHKGESWQGIEACPVCNGKLHLSHAAYNGHVHGRCETNDCLAWME